MSIDKSKIKPVPIQKTLILVNNFLVNTAEFFNTFSNNVEKKISDISKKITEVEVLLAVLEAKLGSVADLVSEPADTPVLPPPADIQPPPAVPAVPAAPAAPAAPTVLALTVTPTQHIEESLAVYESPVPVDDDLIKVSEHPSYMPFFRLLKAGVPLPVISAKAVGEGLDPQYLEQPDALIPRP
jgi:WASH complex subunit CCDC53